MLYTRREANSSFYNLEDHPLGHFGNIDQDLAISEYTNIDFELNYHPVDESFPPPAPSNCQVMPGDSFEDISERMYGDKSFANLLADENGFREDEKPPVGLLLKIPNHVNTNIHNWEGQYPVYTQVSSKH